MLTEQERNRIGAVLLKERESTLDLIAQFDERAEDLRTRAGEMSVYRFHPADVGTESQEQEKDFLLTSMEGRRLYEIDEALSKLYKEPESFGLCAECGRPIGFERLEIVPFAKLCVEDQAATEPDGAAVPREASGEAMA